MSNDQHVKIYSIEAGLLGAIGFAIITSDLSNASYPTAEWFVAVNDWYLARSLRVNSTQLESVGIKVTQQFVEGEALTQASIFLAEYLGSLPPETKQASILASANIRESDLGALAQLWLRGAAVAGALERVYRESGINAVRSELSPVLELTPYRTRDL
jgi:hypothetical protein